MTRKNQESTLICTFVELTTEEITREKISQGVYIVEQAYIMTRSIMSNWSEHAERASTADEMPDYYNSAADITYMVKKFELYDLSDVEEKLGKLIAMIDVVHLVHSCAYRICCANAKHKLHEDYVEQAHAVLELLHKYGHIGDAVMRQPNNTKTKH